MYHQIYRWKNLLGNYLLIFLQFCFRKTIRFKRQIFLKNFSQKNLITIPNKYFNCQSHLLPFLIFALATTWNILGVSHVSTRTIFSQLFSIFSHNVCEYIFLDWKLRKFFMRKDLSDRWLILRLLSFLFSFFLHLFFF